MKNILWYGEFSQTPSGFGTYGRELLARLYATGKYSICELASYTDPTDPRIKNVPWKVVPVKPHPDDAVRQKAYHSATTNQWGDWKLEEVLLENKIDTVLSIRDHWSDEAIERSAFREYFRWVYMTTVDSIPQKVDWLQTFINADALLTYTDWGGEVLREQTNQAVKWMGSAPAGFASEFCPVRDRRAHREAVGLDPDCLIVGMVARNQARKLFPDLCQAFRKYLNEAPHSLAKKTFLYLHTGWPDLGWDLPTLLKEEGLCSRVVMSYLCRSCGSAFPSFFAGHRCACRRCGSHEAAPVSFQNGIPPGSLAAIYNIFDVYVQFANCEGQGMPQVEAAACEVPVFAVDYSAMGEVVRKVNGLPLKVKAMVRDVATHVFRAVPDQDDLVEKLISFLSLPEPVRASKGRDARHGALAHYSYDKAAELWMDVIDRLPPAKPWNAPPSFVDPQPPPGGLTDADFLRWCFAQAGRLDLSDSHIGRTLLRNLEYRKESRESAADLTLNLASKKNFWESRRVAQLRCV